MENKLSKYRQQINQIDMELLELLKKRFAVTEKVGYYKKQHNINVFDEKREQEILKKLLEQLQDTPYKKHIETMWKTLLVESKKQQKNL